MKVISFTLPMAFEWERVRDNKTLYEDAVIEYLTNEVGVQEVTHVEYVGSWLHGSGFKLPHFKAVVPAHELTQLAEFFNRTEEDFLADFSGQLAERRA